MSNLIEINESHRLFASIGKISAAGHSNEQTVKGIMEEIKIYFQPNHCSLLRLDDATGELFFASILGLEIEKVKNIRLKLNEGIAGKVASKQTSYFVPDTSKDPYFTRKVDDLTGFHTKSIIAVPLIFKNKTYGVIEIVNRINGIPYTEADHLILQTIADFAAISLYNAALYEQLLIQAHVDTLTGLYNRTRLNQEIESHKVANIHTRRNYENHILTLVVIDLNNFKEINDSSGHLAGDSVLKDIAHRLKKSLRENDLVFRIGGDEFLIVIYNHSKHDAEKMAQRIQIIIKNIQQEIAAFEISYDFSYGIAQGDPVDFERVFHNADLDMYERKDSKH